MAVTLTFPVADLNTSSNSSAYSLSAFTPSANRILVVFVMTTGNVTHGTVAGGGLTWTRVQTVSDGTHTIRVFWAWSGGSPISTTVTWTATSGSATGCTMTLSQLQDVDQNYPVCNIRGTSGVTDAMSQVVDCLPHSTAWIQPGGGFSFVVENLDPNGVCFAFVACNDSSVDGTEYHGSPYQPEWVRKFDLSYSGPATSTNFQYVVTSSFTGGACSIDLVGATDGTQWLGISVSIAATGSSDSNVDFHGQGGFFGA